MSLSVKQLNSDASFLLSFEPVLPEYADVEAAPRPFTILLDPWITGPSKIFHSKISISTHVHPACISSLSDLPSPPDLVVISQHKSDHCNEATLRQLPASGTRTLILAEPAAARLIRSWKYFDPDKVRTIERWEDPRPTGKESVLRIPVPPIVPGGQGGEVTVAFIPQKRDLANLHSAIGITYRPPPTHGMKIVTATPAISKPPSPSATPGSDGASTNTIVVPDAFLLPPTPPVSPHSLRSVQSASTLLSSPPRPGLTGHFARAASQYEHHHPYPHNPYHTPRPATSSSASASMHAATRPISVLFSPHGVAYEAVAPYATSHLVAEAALPLTALLHCMDTLSNPWWLGGNVCAGAPAGARIADALGARVWLSAHDGDKDVRGLAAALLRSRRWRCDEVRRELGGALAPAPPSRGGGGGGGGGGGEGRPGHKRSTSSGSSGSGAVTTEVLRLGSGGEVVASGGGLLWYSLESEEEQDRGADDDVKVRDLARGAKPIQPLAEKKPPGGLRTRASTRGGLSVRFRSTVVA
ncbi:hypothetical protein GGR52DRAFT_360609 [Hypoxylon sp. FL1284]|nr:hypothetical protein GGR52DRAFT_360609 [Hypoxylon sp. FL1284]